MARQHAPRRHLSPYLLRAVRACGRPRWELSLLAGFPANQQLSNLLHAEVVVASPQTVARVERLADLVGFSRTEVFLEDIR